MFKHYQQDSFCYKNKALKLGIAKKIHKKHKLKPGDVFGKLTLVESVTQKRYGYNGIYWLCMCECGETKVVYQYDLICKKVQSCACLKKLFSEENIDSKSNKNLYKLWHGIKLRCYNKKAIDYKRYGGRGIKMHKEWIDNSAKFIIDIKNSIGPRPQDKTLDRIDNSGNYEPGNLRWATNEEQKLNSSSTTLSEDEIRKIRAKYESRNMQKDIAKEYNMSTNQIWMIINKISWSDVV